MSPPRPLPGPPDARERTAASARGAASERRSKRRSPTNGYLGDALTAIGALAAAAALGVITAAVFAFVSPRATAPFDGSSQLGALNDSASTGGR